MKRILFLIIFLIVTISLKGYAQFSTRLSSNCLNFTYLGFTSDSRTGYITLSFRVVNNCNTYLSNIAFEIADKNITLITNTSSIKNNTYTSPAKKQYVIDDMVTGGISNNPFRSVKFNPVSGFNSGASDIFTFTLSYNSIFEVSWFLVQAKGGDIAAKGFLETVNFVLGNERDGALTALPVSLISFEVQPKEKNQVILSWATASEKDNDFFLVERSTDGKNFSAIGKVKGNGTTLEQKKYAYTNYPAANGTIYYRLKQVDFNGKFEYSKVKATTTKGTIQVTQVNVFPNPATDVLNINFLEANAGATSINIYSLTDKNYKQINLNAASNQTISIQDLATGYYLIQITSASGTIVKKFQKI